MINPSNYILSNVYQYPPTLGEQGQRTEEERLPTTPPTTTTTTTAATTKNNNNNKNKKKNNNKNNNNNNNNKKKKNNNNNSNNNNRRRNYCTIYGFQKGRYGVFHGLFVLCRCPNWAHQRSDGPNIHPLGSKQVWVAAAVVESPHVPALRKFCVTFTCRPTKRWSTFTKRWSFVHLVVQKR